MLPAGLLGRFIRRPSVFKIVQNVAWLSVDQAVRMGIGLAVGVWVARYLGPEEFGRLNYSIAFVGVFAAMGALGLNSVVVREIVRGRDANNAAILGSAFVLQLVGGLVAVLVLFALLASSLVGSDALLRSSIAILSLALPFRAADTVRYWFESQVESRYVVWIENAVFLVMAAARIGLTLVGAGLIAFVVVAAAETVLVSLGLLLVYSKRAGTLARWRADKLHMLSLLHDSWPYFLAGLAVTLYMRMDIVMLQQMTNSYEVGVYSAAARISELLYVLPTVFLSSISPALIESHQTNRALYLARMRQLYAAGWWLAVALSTVLTVFAQEITSLAFGRDFGDAAAVLSIHVWGSMAVIHGITSSQHLLVENLQKLSFYRTLIGLCCNLALNAALIPAFGAKGAAAATAVSYFVATYSLALFGATREHALYMLSSPFGRGASH
jgi:PST family polysaccharide transporter